MVTEEDVLRAYEFFLARAPESQNVIDFHMKSANIRELCNTFLSSDELAAKRPVRLPQSLDLGARLDIDVDLPAQALRKMLRLVQVAWTRLGEDEAYWSVWTAERFRKETFTANADEFYASGQRDVKRFLAWLDRNRISTATLSCCCEYGCGTGRVTPWLAQSFAHVNGCDISTSHLKLAKETLSRQGSRNVTLTHVSTLEDVAAVARFDALFSIVVLQHNPPPVMAVLLRTLLSRLNPGGVAYFQLPTYAVGYRFSSAEWLASDRAKSMEMHVLPQRDVFRICEESQCRILEVEPDGYVPDRCWLSTTFLVLKAQSVNYGNIS